jgi:hypothetical protein
MNQRIKDDKIKVPSFGLPYYESGSIVRSDLILDKDMRNNWKTPALLILKELYNSPGVSREVYKNTVRVISQFFPDLKPVNNYKARNYPPEIELRSSGVIILRWGNNISIEIYKDNVITTKIPIFI